MERFPEEWLCEPLEGPHATLEATYMEHGSRYYHCLLCGACQITSQLTLNEHVRGRRHERRYKLLQQQQKSWFLDQLVPLEFMKTQGYDNDNNINHNINKSPTTMNNDDDNNSNSYYEDLQEENTLSLSYIMPFRKWQRNNLCWTAGMTCQLCGTGDMATRFDVAHHCLTSQRHATFRSNTNYLGEYHFELKRLVLPRVNTLPKRYKWEMERHMIAYVGSKEAAFAGLASQAWEWYHLLHTLEVYELRAKLMVLELAIWKASMIEDDATMTSTLACSSSSPSFREERRTTCGSTVILQNVFAFLQTLPRLENEFGW